MSSISENDVCLVAEPPSSELNHTTNSLYDAIQERYSYDDNELNESLKNFTLLFNKSDDTNKPVMVATSPPRNGSGLPPSTDSPRKLNSITFSID